MVVKRRRRKRGSDSGGGGALGLVLLVLFMAFGFIASAVATVTIFAVPIFTVIAAVGYAFVSSEPPQPPDLAEYDPRNTWKKISELRHQIENLENAARKAFLDGQRSCIDFRIHEEDEPWRFKEHSRLGKELNRRLDAIDAKLAAIDTTITNIKRQVFNALPDWRIDFDRWRFHAAIKFSLKIAMATYLVAITALLLLGLGGSYSLSDHVFIKVLPPNLYEPAFGASIASTLVGFFAFAWKREGLSDCVDGHFISQHNALLEKWNPNDPELTQLEPDFGEEIDFEEYQYEPQDENGEDGPTIDPRSQQQRWFEVLQIPENRNAAAN